MKSNDVVLPLQGDQGGRSCQIKALVGVIFLKHVAFFFCSHFLFLFVFVFVFCVFFRSFLKMFSSYFLLLFMIGRNKEVADGLVASSVSSASTGADRRCRRS